MVNHNIFASFTFKNGTKLNNRIAMCPMLVFASEENGSPSSADLAYFERRNQFGGLLITGAATISPQIKCTPNQLSFENDDQIPAFSQLAQTMQANGSKAVVQLQHPGREAAVGYLECGKAYAPSKIDFPFLNHSVEELTHEQILAIIEDFGQATKRLIEAGFDGVEIHGANHYLLQQFFSAYSNRRTDQWGGSLEKRMSFPLAVTKKVIEVARQEKPDFIVGYRLSPEEVHGENIGYVIDDTLQLIDQLAALDLGYIHTSTYGGGDFGKLAYKLLARAGNQSAPINQLVKETINGRTALIVSGSIRSAAEAEDALNYGDIVGMGVPALADPDFTLKIAAGKEDELNFNIKDRAEDLKLPPGLIAAYQNGAPFPILEGVDEI